MKNILHELKHHLPFTVYSGVAGIIIVAVLTVFMSAIIGINDEVENETAEENHDDDHEHDHEHEGVGELGNYFYELFHVFHPLHALFSAATTTAMFWRFDKKLWKAVIIGLIGSLAICGISDIFFPFIGGTLAGIEMDLHFCLIEHPMIVVPFSIIGIIMGLITCEIFIDRKSTIFSHSAHIFISTMASLLYLVTFGYTNWMEELFIVFIIVILAVFLPCCISDIVFPLLFVDESKKKTKPVCLIGEDEHDI
jgi:hypothetical protein